MAIIIYKIESLSKRIYIYIGQSKNFAKRACEYKALRCASQHILYKSLVKHGYDNHKISIILKLDDNTVQKEVDAFEIYYIQFYKDLNVKMMNIADGGCGGLVNEEAREKLRKAQTGKKYSEESKRKMSEAHKGKSSSRKGKKNSKLHIKRISKGGIGKCVGAEHWRTKTLINIITNEKYYSITEAAKKLV